MTWGCPCGRRWTGLVQAHCTVCHEHFSTVRAFDLHVPSYRGCGDPRTMTGPRGQQPLFKAVEGALGTTWSRYSSRPHPSDTPAGGKGA